MKISKNILFILIILIALTVAVSLAYWYFYVKKEIVPPPPPASEATSTPIVPGFKLYRNEEWGFEFEYPADWTLHIIEELSRGPSSKFQLIGTTPKEKVPNTIVPSLIVNIVIPAFADRAAVNFKNLSTTDAVTVIIGDITGIKYEYKFANQPRIAIDLPFGEYRILLGANKEHESIFNQILASFKFFK